VHISVLQNNVLELFRGKKLNLFIDATLGACGHSLALLQEHKEITCIVGFDRDASVLERAKSLLPEGSILIHSNFRHLKKRLSEHKIDHADGILLDIGVSSMQLDTPERGFSFMQEGPLDMRMDASQSLTAEDVVNSYPEEKLANIIYAYGEEHASRKVAKAICQARRKRRITTTQELVEVIETVLPRRGRLHPATKTFQALRIEVNQELESLQSALEQALELLSPGGVLAVISFHSLEDRIVKLCFRSKSKEEFVLLTKKPIEASQEEARENPRARSAKLRGITKL
jgi:16S rRNA (cytosine1402-N4)-methyltransferase